MNDFYDVMTGEPVCPECGGPGVALGTLGYILHLRCRNCGMDFSTDSRRIDHVKFKVRRQDGIL